MKNQIDFDSSKFEKDEYGNLYPKDEPTIENVKYPICPINMYWEGDEDKCNIDDCDFDTETRSCTGGCSINIEDVCSECKKCGETTCGNDTVNYSCFELLED